jgi:hypothetical protein
MVKNAHVLVHKDISKWVISHTEEIRRNQLNYLFPPLPKAASIWSDNNQHKKMSAKNTLRSLHELLFSSW